MCLQNLEKDDSRKGVKAVKKERNEWIDFVFFPSWRG